jgi:hypothetical protein
VELDTNSSDTELSHEDTASTELIWAERFLENSQRVRVRLSRKAKASSRHKRRNVHKRTIAKAKSFGGHDLSVIRREVIKRRNTSGECLVCAWPSDRKGAHCAKDCRRAIKLSEGTALSSQAKA